MRLPSRRVRNAPDNHQIRKTLSKSLGYHLIIESKTKPIDNSIDLLLVDYFFLVVRNVALVDCFVSSSAHPVAMPEATPLHHQQAREAIDMALAAHGFDRQAWIETAVRLHRMAVREAPADQSERSDFRFVEQR